MKKILLVFTILFILAATACQHQTDMSAGLLKRPGLFFNNYEDYVSFITSGKLPSSQKDAVSDLSSFPDDFILYEKISMMGKFQALLFLCPTYMGDYSAYMYRLIDENGFEYSLYIDHNKKDTEKATAILSDAQADTITDLRTSPKSQVNHVQIKDITYQYWAPNNGLGSLVWSQNDITFTLASSYASEYDNYSGYFSEYPMDGKDTFIKQLLTTPRTPAEIQQMCSSKLEKE